MPRIFPIYLFTGDDEYLKREAAGKLKKALLGASKSEAFNFHVYDAKKCDIRDVMDVLKSVPFISEKRLVLLKNIDAADHNAEKAIKGYVKNPSKSACLVMESSKTDPNGAFYRELRNYVREVTFIVPKGERIIGWIQKEVRSKDKMMRHDAARLLRELKKDDINGLRNEIDKLVTYAGRRNIVSREDVVALVGSSPTRGVFDFVHSLSKKDAKAALAIARELLSTKKKVPEILGMIGWQFRRIKRAQGLLKKGDSGKSASAKCKIPPFFIERFMKEIKSFSEKEIDRNIDHLLEADNSIKRGYAKPQEALELLIVKVCGGDFK